MALAYIWELLKEEQHKAVNTIQHGPHVPNNRLHHHEPSARQKESQHAAAVGGAEHRLNDESSNLDFFQWIHLNPKLSAEEPSLSRIGRMPDCAVCMFDFCCIHPCRDRLGFYAEIRIKIGTVC